MLVGLTCACGGADIMVRNVLKKCKVDDWMGVVIYQGKDQCEAWGQAHKHLEGEVLLELFLRDNNVFALIVGYDDERLRFANVKNGSIKERLDAEIIASEFATK